MGFDSNNYLDIWNILVYEIIGNVNLTLILGLILIAYFTARYSVPFQTAMALMILYFAIVSILTGQIGLWTLIIFIVGALFYWVIARMFRRN